ncbi:MAG: diguanylate cyclase [Deltaproteobacteria bacterium]|nr:GGDEF domain-containing protein [Candidatus Deferrimicrobiaceae bacterium]
MPPPSLLKGKARVVRSYSVPAFSVAHLLMFLWFRRGDGWAGGAAAWAASAFAVLACLLIRDFLTSRRQDRLPDIPAALAWGAAGLLELHSLSSVVADSRIVPAILFPSAAHLLPAIPAATYAAAAFAWLLFAPDGLWPPEGRLASIALLGILGLAAGRAVRRKLQEKGSGRDRVQEAIDESRSLIFPWESSDAASDRELSAEVERWGPLRSREDLMDAIRRILEGILPITGADRILYVFPSPGQGRSFRAGAFACRGRDPGIADVSIPDDYIPVREATVFRRTFFSDGEGAGSWAIGDGDEGGARPTGVAAAPVVCDGNVEGAILALRTAEGRWNEPVGQALEMAAYLAARELAMARRQFRAHRYLAMQEGFHRLIRRIAEISEKVDGDGQENVSPRREVYRAAVEQVRRHLDAGRVLLIEAERGGKRGRIAWETGEEIAADREEKVSLKGTYVEWVLGQGVHRIFSADSAPAGRFPVLPPAWTRSHGGGCLLVPVTGAADGFHGAIVCEAGEGRNFDGQDADTVKDMLAIMRMGISHALRLENLEKEAKNDGLTGLLNRKTFCAQLTNLLSRLDGRYPCAVVMLDIDHFKKVNDTYGHPAGDEVIRKVSSVIRKTVRKVDMAGRYGGEEFVLYLHSTDPHHAGQIAERLRLMIRQTRFVFEKREVGVTASLGIACYPGDGKTPEELLHHADVALYRSKQGGRDRTTAFVKQ